MTQQIAVRDQVTQLKQQLEARMDTIARSLPANFMTAPRFAQIVTTLCAQNPTLLGCKPASLIGAVLRCATLGLSPEPALGQGYFLPFKGIVQFVPGYKGYAVLAWRSGMIASLGMQVVRDGDDFDYGLGTGAFVRHRPRAPIAATITHAYARAKPVGGEAMFEVLTREEIDATMARSPSGRSGKSPWTTDFEAMAKKTAFRRLAKLLPQSTDPVAPLQRALDLDERAELGIRQHNVEDLLGDIEDEPKDEPGANG
jgi:recombination protein RecT